MDWDTATNTRLLRDLSLFKRVVPVGTVIQEILRRRLSLVNPRRPLVKRVTWRRRDIVWSMIKYWKLSSLDIILYVQ